VLWRVRQFEFVFPRPPLLMGILNVTPDSFSDGGRFLDPGAAVAHGLQLVAEGADLLDIGGESTRPNAQPVSAGEESRRVLPVIRQLAGQVKIPISIDTTKLEVARAALDAGASLINDIAANRADEAMWRLAAATGAGYVLMHMQGTPQTMQQSPRYDDVLVEVSDFFRERLSRIAACGVSPEQVVLDPGLGFGKKLEHNLQLLAQLGHFTQWQRPLLVGASRKSFIGTMLGAGVADRLSASLACACWAIREGACVLRVHDVAATRQALAMTAALQGNRTV